MREAVVVGKSKIHGTGVFANRSFAKGEVVLVLDDSHPVPDRSKLTERQVIHIDVFIGRDGKERVTFMKSPEKYVNTSCDPNVFIRTDMRSGIRRAYSLRSIRSGEELTWDYALNSSEEWEIPAECRCGSPNCRGTIHGNFFTLPKEIQMRYVPLLDQPFREKFKREIAKIRRVSRQSPPHS